MTTYYIEWHMRQKLKPILFDALDGGNFRLGLWCER
jgi:hypothetical protein